MDNRECDSIKERNFDTMLESSVSGLPPEDVVVEVTPWRKAMRRVLAGIALCTITLNFLCLNYILPAIGMVLSILGFRSLRRENKWFRNCFIITVIRAVYFFPLLILNTTIIQSTILALPVMSVLTVNALAG